MRRLRKWFVRLRAALRPQCEFCNAVGRWQDGCGPLACTRHRHQTRPPVRPLDAIQAANGFVRDEHMHKDVR